MITMTKLPSLLVITISVLFMTTITQSSSARTLGNPTPNHNHSHHKITFFIRDLLNGSQQSAKPAPTKVTDQLPFQKPLGLFPPNGGIPIPQSIPTIPATASSTQTLDLSSIGFSFPTRATLQELEFGTVTLIDQELLEEGERDELQRLGRAQGVYVASSEDGSSHMMAMTANFFAEGEYEDGLRLFGVQRTDVFESHVAVIGGTGKYQGANGYATIKVVDRVRSELGEGTVTKNRLLLFDVYLS